MKPFCVPARVFGRVFLVSLCLCLGCRPASAPEPRLFRFLDHLGDHNVMQIPALLSDVSKIPAIHDLGISSEAFELKKKVIFKDLALNAILAPPESKFKFDVRVPRKALLHFGYGILEKSWENSSGVRFEILLGGGEEMQVLFSDTLVPGENEKHRELFERTLDMTEYGGDVLEMYLVTKPAGGTAVADGGGADSDLSFWFNPVIAVKEDSDRQPRERKSNIILISIDTLRWDRLGCYGFERDISPNIDLLAQDGVRFQHCYAQSNWTLPSHVSLLTSLNSYRHQVYMGNERMSPSLITLADVLRVHDYFCCGITGGGYVGEQFGFSKGFDRYKSEQYKLHPARDEAESLRDAAMEWLEANQDKDFFLFLHTYQVHTPYYYHPGLTEAFSQGELSWDQIHLADFLREQPQKRRYPFTEKEIADIVALYNGEVKYTDAMFIKPLIQKLKDLGLYDRTMIVFTSDHGEELLDHESWLHSHTLYDELIRVPLIIKYPASRHAGVQIEPIVRSIDIMPTILSVAGIDAAPFDLDGESLQDVVRGKETGNRVFMSDFTRQGSADVRPRMVCTNQDFYKLIVIRKPSPPKFHLYDLAADPYERNRLDEARLDLVKNLFRSIRSYYKDFAEVPAKSSKVVMDKALEERLKALGYIR